ncbi:right-handed parallel beta-helix repeat-containing protein [Kitasatospora herbaricolor]|uniref:right-handed parallel beta-helix repeat-containing protein n=1 Tax=Kitasatospora herbaricolor TaxID=68217 RepID=UPI0036DD4E37
MHLTPSPTRRCLSVLLAAATAAAVLIGLPATPAAAAGTTYYVDCSQGAAGNGTQASPWNSLTAVDATTFAPGDKILLNRGTTCHGTLSPKGSGAAGAPIIVDTYGTGAQPRVAGDGAPDAVYLFNQQYWEIRNLEITNHGATVANRRGVHIELQDYGTGTYFRLTNLTVHDVNGDNTKDVQGSSGIHLDVAAGTGSVQSKFSDIVLDGNTVYTVDRTGIEMSSDWWCRPEVNCSSGLPYVPWSGVVVQNNTVHDIGGDGIVMQYSQNGLNQYNTAYDINMRSGLNNAGIWAWNADHVTFQFNEAYRVQRPAGTNDGMAFDADYGTDGTTFQYNYSHDNQGGFILYCGCGGGSSSTKKAVVRYNVSQNDASRIIYAAGATDGLFYNNTIYLPTGSTTAIVEQSNTTYLTLANNIIANYGTGGYIVGNGAVNNYTWTHNVFDGNHPSNEPSDPYKVTANPQFSAPGSGGKGIGTVTGYQLQAGSPARANGLTIGANGGRDYAGAAIPKACAPDRGALQSSPFTDSSCNATVNPGFESGLAPWTNTGSGQLTTQNPHTGTQAARNGRIASSIQQPVAVQPNTTYRLTGYTFTTDPTSPVRIGVNNYGGTDTYQAITATSYTQGTVTFTTGPTTSTANVYCSQPSGGNYSYCDDFTVIPT